MLLAKHEVGELKYRSLLAGSFPVARKTITLKAPTEKLLVGSVIGLATEDKKGALLKKDAADGTEKFYGILLHEIEPAEEDVSAVVAVTGEFIEDNLIFGEGTSADDVRDDAEMLNVYFRKLVNKNEEE